MALNHDIRKTGIGGSEAAAVLGLHPNKTRMQVYMDKMGMSGDQPDNELMEMGRFFEPAIANIYAARKGKELVESDTLRHPTHPFLIGTPDRLVRGEALGLEIKKVFFTQKAWGLPETDQIPQHYLIQCAVYMAILDYPQWDVAVDLGSSVAFYTVNRDPELEGLIIEGVERFVVDHLMKQMPPPLEASEASARYLARKYPTAGTEMKEADEEARRWAKQLKEGRALGAHAEDMILQAENYLKEIIGNARGITGPGFKVLWSGGDKPRSIIDWQGLAKSLTPTAGQIAAFTTVKPGSRRFLPTFEE